MATKGVPFSKFNTKLEVNTKEITFQNTTILVCQNLPTEDKLALVDVTLQEATVNGIIHPLLTEVYFLLNIVFKYTNITFTDKQREDKLKLFDQLQSSGLIHDILIAIPKAEYLDLQRYLEETQKALEAKSTSFAAKITDYLDELPQKMAEAAEIAKSFDPQQFESVMNMAKALRTDNFNAVARMGIDKNSEAITNLAKAVVDKTS